LPVFLAINADDVEQRLYVAVFHTAAQGQLRTDSLRLRCDKGRESEDRE